MLATHAAFRRPDDSAPFADPSVCAACVGEPTNPKNTGLDCYACGCESRPCPACRGNGEELADPECSSCDGHGWTCRACTGGQVHTNLCREHSIDEDDRFVIRATSLLESGISPFSEAPGWGDWPARFVDAVGIVAAEREDVRRLSRED